jgi:hypothetical protein
MLKFLPILGRLGCIFERKGILICRFIYDNSSEEKMPGRDILRAVPVTVCSGAAKNGQSCKDSFKGTIMGID